VTRDVADNFQESLDFEKFDYFHARIKHGSARHRLMLLAMAHEEYTREVDKSIHTIRQ